MAIEGGKQCYQHQYGIEAKDEALYGLSVVINGFTNSSLFNIANEIVEVHVYHILNT